MPSDLIDVERLSAILRVMREHGATHIECSGVKIDLAPMTPVAPVAQPVNALAVADALLAGATSSTATPAPQPTIMSRAGLEKRRKANEALGLVPINEMTPAEIALASAGTYNAAIDDPKEPPAAIITANGIEAEKK